MSGSGAPWERGLQPLSVSFLLFLFIELSVVLGGCCHEPSSGTARKII